MNADGKREETPPYLSFFLFPRLLVPLELGGIEKENQEAMDVLVFPLKRPPTYCLYSTSKREAISTISGIVWQWQAITFSFNPS